MAARRVRVARRMKSEGKGDGRRGGRRREWKRESRRPEIHKDSSAQHVCRALLNRAGPVDLLARRRSRKAITEQHLGPPATAGRSARIRARLQARKEGDRGSRQALIEPADAAKQAATSDEPGRRLDVPPSLLAGLSSGRFLQPRTSPTRRSGRSERARFLSERRSPTQPPPLRPSTVELKLPASSSSLIVPNLHRPTHPASSSRVDFLNAMPSVAPTSYRIVSAAKIATRDSLLPPDTHLAHKLALAEDQGGALNVTAVPGRVLSASELEITELEPDELVRRLASSALSAVEVTAAFIKRASVAQQLVRPPENRKLPVEIEAAWLDQRRIMHRPLAEHPVLRCTLSDQLPDRGLLRRRDRPSGRARCLPCARGPAGRAAARSADLIEG
jgi:hypothetical protein